MMMLLLAAAVRGVSDRAYMNAHGARMTCRPGIKGSFVHPERDGHYLLKRLMQRVRNKEPFAWVHWGDGEMIRAAREPKYASLMHTWPRMADQHMYAAIAVWWMCGSFESQWNMHALSNYTYLDYVYLCMGDPRDHDMMRHRKAGVKGWIVEAHAARRNVVVIGPSFLRSSKSYLHYIDYYDTPNPIDWQSVVHILNFIRRQTAPDIIFAVMAGTSAKYIITKAYAENPNHTFIDVGSALDPYSGVASRGQDVKEYCNAEATHAHLYDGLQWMADDLCVHHEI